MYPVSNRWDKAIRAGGVRKTVCDFYYGVGDGDLIYSDIPVHDYEIRVDRRSHNRRSGNLTIVDSDILTKLTSNPGVSPVEPYGGQFVLRTGVVYEDDTEELVPIGRFTVEDMSWVDPGNSMTLEIFDRSKILARSTQWYAPNRRSVLDAIEDICTILSPPLPTGVLEVAASVAAKDFRLPAGALYEGDSWKVIIDLCTTLGAEPYFDVSGVLQIREAVNITQPYNLAMANWTVDTGETGVLLPSNRRISRKDTFNMVTVFGSPPDGGDVQPSAFVVDDNPASPTYWKGPFGRSDTSFEMPELHTVDACRRVAGLKLNMSKGLSKTVELSTLANPALDAGDVLVVEFLNGVREVHVIEAFALSKSAGSMNIETRHQFTV